MDMNKQLSMLTDLICDVVEREEPDDEKRDAIIKRTEINDRFGEAFATFLGWFKLVQDPD